MPEIRRVGIISKPSVAAGAKLVPRVIQWLRERCIEVRCDAETAAYAPAESGVPRAEVPENCDLVIVLGGDGTLLSAARAIGGRDIPLFAVNLGGLGFLTAITVEELYIELERFFQGEYRLGRRRMLDCELVRGGEVIGSYSALNDVVIT